jgi:hypothetical protein
MCMQWASSSKPCIFCYPKSGILVVNTSKCGYSERLASKAALHTHTQKRTVAGGWLNSTVYVNKDADHSGRAV